MSTGVRRRVSERQFSIYLLHLRDRGEIWVVRTHNLPHGYQDGVPLCVEAVGGPLSEHEIQAIRYNATDWPERSGADLPWFWQQLCDGAPTEHIYLGFE